MEDSYNNIEDIVCCNVCFDININIDNVCEKCEKYYCDEHSVPFTIHNQVDFNCCIKCHSGYRYKSNKFIKLRNIKILYERGDL